MVVVQRQPEIAHLVESLDAGNLDRDLTAAHCRRIIVAGRDRGKRRAPQFMDCSVHSGKAERGAAVSWLHNQHAAEIAELIESFHARHEATPTGADA
jgi:hypothetical protein